MELKNMLVGTNPSTPKHRTIVRVIDSYYETKRGCSYKRDLQVLKRKSFGYNIVNEDCTSFGAEDFMTIITNLHEVKPGVYELIYCNIYKDWETGYADDWNYKLVPFEEEV